MEKDTSSLDRSHFFENWIKQPQKINSMIGTKLGKSMNTEPRGDAMYAL